MFNCLKCVIQFSNAPKHFRKSLPMDATEINSKTFVAKYTNIAKTSQSKATTAELPEINSVQKEIINNDELDGDNKIPEDEIVVIDETDDENSSGNIYTRRLSLYGMAGKKAAAQGLMDIALITANANQLRYILEFNRGSHSFHITVSLIIISLALQVAVAMFLIFKGRYYVKGMSKSINAKRMKNCVLLGVFLITVVNVFIASFTTMESAPK